MELPLLEESCDEFVIDSEFELKETSSTSNTNSNINTPNALFPNRKKQYATFRIIEENEGEDVNESVGGVRALGDEKDVVREDAGGGTGLAGDEGPWSHDKGNEEHGEGATLWDG